VKGMNTQRTARGYRQFTFLALVLLVLALRLPQAVASTVLVSDTSLVSGSESSVYSFVAPGPGTVTVELSNLAWPETLSSLTFTATTANRVLSSWQAPGAEMESFQVSGGTYFAHVSATAGGTLDLGLYSLYCVFTPASQPVPIPPGAGLLLSALLGLILWRRLAQRPTASPAFA
jgi:hypothetical protein